MNLSSLINVNYCYTYLIDQIPVNLLLYSHIPTALISLFFSSYILIKKKSRLGIILFIISLLFTFWCLFDLSTWFSFLGSANTMFTWSILDLIALLMFFLSYYFLYTFITANDLPIRQKVIGFILLLPAAITTFLGSNLTTYNANICEANENSLITKYPYVIEAILIMFVIYFIVNRYIKTKDYSNKRKILLMGSGISIFLIFFFSATFLVSLLAGEASLYAYNYEIYGLFGMPILLIFLGYVVIKYQAFNVKLIATQALVWGLVTLIGAQFLFISGTTNLILNSITFVSVIVFGQFLIDSVKKEVEQKERLQLLTTQLSAANEKLKGLDKLKSEFVSLASHQLRSPLTAIKGYTSMLMEGDYGEINPQAKETIDRIMESSNNLTLVVEDLLNVTKIEQGGMKYEMAKFDFSDEVRNTAKDLSITAEKKGLKLICNVPEDQKYTVNGDKEKIRQVLINIIDNAMKYTKEGEIVVNLNSNNGKILLSIKDTGAGISKETIDTLFKKFSRGDGAKLNVSGTGLGLYLVKEIVEAHKGRVWVESEGLGKGSTFFVELNEEK